MKSDWQVLLIGGSSGVGKSHLARKLAEHYKTSLTEIDDIRIALEQLVSRDEYPDLFTLIDNPEYRSNLTEQEFTEKLLNIAAVVWKSLDVLISKHVRLKEKVIFEGDGIVPVLLSQRDLDLVKAVFVYDDIENIKQKQRQRSRPGNPPQHAETDALFAHTHNATIYEQAKSHGFLTIKASPVETLYERLVALIDAHETLSD